MRTRQLFGVRSDVAKSSASGRYLYSWDVASVFITAGEVIAGGFGLGRVCGRSEISLRSYRGSAFGTCYEGREIFYGF